MERIDRQQGIPRRDALRALAMLGAIAASAPLAAFGSSPRAAAIEVYKNASCGCCGAWVEHLERSGFAVKVNEVPDTAPVRKRLGMPAALGSCHTARIDRYVIEGHVPAADIRRLLAERPDALGLAVPGMPVGSPGMEVPGKSEPYDVLLVSKAGRTTVFTSYRP